MDRPPFVDPHLVSYWKSNLHLHSLLWLPVKINLKHLERMNPSLQKLLYFICILYLFYCYHTYFNPLLILLSSILLLFSLIRKIDHPFYCCFTSIETLFYKQWSILSLFYYTKPQNSLKIDYFNPILWKCWFVK